MLLQTCSEGLVKLQRLLSLALQPGLCSLQGLLVLYKLLHIDCPTGCLIMRLPYHICLACQVLKIDVLHRTLMEPVCGASITCVIVHTHV